MSRNLLFFSFWLAMVPFAQAVSLPDATLLVDHEIAEVGADGITRQMSFQERYLRRGDQVWIERVLPFGAHDAHEHAKGGHSHKHLDLAAAARWIVLDKDQRINVRLVNTHDKVVINVPAAEYGNIGFDGNRDNVFHLLGPVQLQGMRETGKAAGEVREYELRQGERRLRVSWDTRLELPRRVESSSGQGLSRKLMVARDVPPPKTLPWTNLQSYRQKEFSDYLD